MKTQYNKDKFISNLRKSVLCLTKQCYKKLKLGQFSSAIELNEYISYIFEKALILKLSPEILYNISVRRAKFTFLQHDDTTIDDIIHGISYELIALCNEDKIIVQNALVSLTSSKLILDSAEIYANKGLAKYFIDSEEAANLCCDVASLTKKCIREFLQELRDTGKIMTSTELEEYHRSLSDTKTDSPETSTDMNNSVSSDDSDTNTKDSRESATTRAAFSSDGGHQIEESLDIDANGTREKSNAITQPSTEDNPNPLLNQLLSWIYELPEWLQEQILNSSPIKALIESTKQWDAVYNRKSVIDIFAESSSVDIASDSVDDTKDNINAKATIAQMYYVDSIDMSMILNEPTAHGWILPTVAIGSDNLFGADAGFNGLLNFNGLDSLNVF